MAKTKDKISAHPRKLARSVARVKMQKAGLHDINDSRWFLGKHYDSYFATHWREVLTDAKS